MMDFKFSRCQCGELYFQVEKNDPCGACRINARHKWLANKVGREQRGKSRLLKEFA